MNYQLIRLNKRGVFFLIVIFFFFLNGLKAQVIQIFLNNVNIDSLSKEKVIELQGPPIYSAIQKDELKGGEFEVLKFKKSTFYLTIDGKSTIGFEINDKQILIKTECCSFAIGDNKSRLYLCYPDSFKKAVIVGKNSYQIFIPLRNLDDQLSILVKNNKISYISLSSQ